MVIFLSRQYVKVVSKCHNILDAGFLAKVSNSIIGSIVLLIFTRSIKQFGLVEKETYRRMFSQPQGISEEGEAKGQGHLYIY